MCNDLQQKTYFDTCENQYDRALLLNPKKHVQEELEIIQNKLGNIKDKIIDFGAGVGRLTIFLIKKNYHILAIDISRESLHTLESEAVKINKKNYLLTGTNLPLRADKNAIIGSDILHHVDIKEKIPLIYASLKKGAKIIFSEPNFWHIFWLLHIFINTDWDIEKGIVQCTYLNLNQVLKKQGFKKIKLTGFGLFPPLLFNEFSFLSKINYFLGNLPLLKLFSFRIIIEAYK